FLLVHLWDFRIAKEFIDPEEYDLAQMVIDRLRQPVGTAIYLAGIGLVGLHLWHGFQSSFQTLGLSHPRYRALAMWTGRLISLALVAGFGGIPVFIFLTR
ncbi:MAG: hypothetical protein AAFP86_06565, partial [Planctomycetota bacterium]